jgi:hypothetical protein
MVFKLSRTFTNPARSQSGFATPGAGAQQSGPVSEKRHPDVPWFTKRWAQGARTWLRPTTVAASTQRGFGSPLSRSERRPRGSMPNVPPIYGGVYQHYTPYFDRGAAAYVPNFGYLLTNPIGAGVVALYRPQASYGSAGQYENGAIWWTSQVVPTSINLQGLTDPQELAAIFDNVTIQGVVRTTG